MSGDPEARSAPCATSATAAGTSGPRGQRTRRSVSAASANDPPVTIAISARRVGVSQPVTSSIAGTHSIASPPMRSPARIPRRSAISPSASVSAAHVNSSAKIAGVRLPLTTRSRASVVSSAPASRVPSARIGCPLTPSGTPSPRPSRIVAGMSMPATTPSRRVVDEVSRPGAPRGRTAPAGSSWGVVAWRGVCTTIEHVAGAVVAQQAVEHRVAPRRVGQPDDDEAVVDEQPVSARAEVGGRAE